MKRILVLDDNDDILYIVEKILSDAGYLVKSTRVSEGIVELAESWQPDLFILDYKLADGDGGMVCQSFKSHKNLRKTAIIIFSAYMQKGLKFEDFGCDAFIAKPFDIFDMVNTVKALTGNSC